MLNCNNGGVQFVSNLHHFYSFAKMPIFTNSLK